MNLRIVLLLVLVATLVVSLVRKFTITKKQPPSIQQIKEPEPPKQEPEPPKQEPEPHVIATMYCSEKRGVDTEWLYLTQTVNHPNLSLVTIVLHDGEESNGVTVKDTPMLVKTVAGFPLPETYHSGSYREFLKLPRV